MKFTILLLGIKQTIITRVREGERGNDVGVLCAGPGHMPVV